MAAKQQPQTRRKRRGAWWGTKPATQAAKSALAAGRAALAGEGESLTADSALALREQLRLEDEARRTMQGCLKLGPAA
jgi:hypothetical protein